MTEEATENAAEEAEDEEITGIYEYDATEMRDVLADRLLKRADEFEKDANIEAGLGAANRYKVATFRWGAEELRTLAGQFRVAPTSVVRTFKRSEIGDPDDFDDDDDEVRIDEALAADLAKTKAENETLKAELHAFGLKFEALEATTKLLQHHSAVEAAPTPGTPSVGASFTGGFVNPSSPGGGILTGDQTTVE